MMEKQPLLKVEELELRIGGILAVDNVNFEIYAGEIVGLVGPNGAGKTSVLNVINGIYRPDKGSVSFEGKEITKLPPHKIARLGIGRSFQLMELFRGMTVLENLLVGCHPVMKSNLFASGAFWKLGQKEELAFRRRVEEIIDFMELETYRKQEVGSLPTGAQKLIGVARALCMQPKILLLDEPSSGLSRDEKEDLARFLLRIKYEMGIPILWIEHDMGLIGELADRLVVLHYGKKIAEGAWSEVSQHPDVVSAFSGV